MDLRDIVLQYRNVPVSGQGTTERRVLLHHTPLLSRTAHDRHATAAAGLQFQPKASRLRPQENRRMSSVLKKRRKKVRKHKYKKLRRRQKFLRRKS